MLDYWNRLAPETKALIVGSLLSTIAASVKAFLSSKKASFFEKAHEAVVTGIEHSDCEDCRQAAKAVAVDLGIEKRIKPIIAAIKDELPVKPPTV